MKRIARVFPRKTNASPVDELAFYSEPGFWPPDVDEVHISVTFTYDLPRAEYLAKAWAGVAPVKIGGVAMGDRGEEFIAGMYLRHGYVITSRGCPNNCWFCSVPKREGREIRELPICDGYNLLDDNILACSESHIRDVFAMLSRQRDRARLTGGLEAARLLPWHVDSLVRLRPISIFFAYDTPDDYEPLRHALAMLRDAGFSSSVLRCYVLCGYPRDRMDDAEVRMREVCALGADPMAMLYRDNSGKRDPTWQRFARVWARPAAYHSLMRDERMGN